MRQVVVAGNWKMNSTPSDAGTLAASLAAVMTDEAVVRVICPPAIALPTVAATLAGTGIATGAQNVHAEARGAYTGEISAAMIAPYATWAIVGHSERRRDQAETDALIGRKLIRCREHGLRPILCVGELLTEREAGAAETIVRGQLAGALEVLEPGLRADAAAWLVVAYEPVWAIGTGRTASGADAALMTDVIRDGMRAMGIDADQVPVLYGGSVTSAAIGEFLAEPAIDGALVGGASLKVEEMAGIVARAGVTARARTHAAATR
ncbi:MAG: triose-phosphate isomerase [Candidatus Limnocylindrales bacterium]